MKRLTKALPKKFSLFLLAAIIGLTSTAAVLFANADLSGEWKLNEQKSELGQFGRMAAKSLKINEKADALTIERKATSPNGDEITLTDNLTFDGKESESTLFGNTKKKSTATWSEDGQALNVNSTILFDRNGETTEIKVQETWKLIDNGQALSVESTSNSQWGTNTMKLVYEKAK